MTTNRMLATYLLVAALAALGACSDAPDPTGPNADEAGPSLHRGSAAGAFRVYSQNVYLGGDTGPLLSLDFGDIPALLQATGVFWAQVQESDPRARAAAVVDQIEARHPHLIGLQEVFHFRVVDFASGAPRPIAEIDLLELVESEIHARALPYEVVAVQENTTTGPASGLPLMVDPAAGMVTRVLQFTDRIAVLRRTDVEVGPATQGRFAASFDVGPLTLTRGWIRVPAVHSGAEWHFVTTHLETQALAPIQDAQASELIGTVLAGLDATTVLGGDLNSDAANPGAPSWTPTYDRLLAAGFTDAWEQSGHSSRDPCYTCCQSPDLRNAMSTLDERIDFVLVRAAGNPSASGLVPGSIVLDILGAAETDRTTQSGLWPSDHAGLMVSLRLAPGLANRRGG
jgi:endonuclease/exonuclease/phosphatase family metal-dependent hydrolase